MAISTDEIRVGANGSIHVAPIASTLPTTPTATLATPWINLGYTTEDGATFSRDPSFEKVRAWQSGGLPVRVMSTTIETMVSFDLMQWNKDTVALAFGGGSVTEPTADIFKFEFPDPEEVDERALVLSWQDGDISNRLICPRVQVMSAIEVKLARSEVTTLSCQAEVLASTVAPYILTDDPAMEPA
jgi:hypothetical protein